MALVYEPQQTRIMGSVIIVLVARDTHVPPGDVTAADVVTWATGHADVFPHGITADDARRIVAHPDSAI